MDSRENRSYDHRRRRSPSWEEGERRSRRSPSITRDRPREKFSASHSSDRGSDGPRRYNAGHDRRKTTRREGSRGWASNSPSLSPGRRRRWTSGSRSPTRFRSRNDYSDEESDRHQRRRQRRRRRSSDDEFYGDGRDRRRDRHRREKGASMRKLDRPLEAKPTKVAALRNVPLESTEEEIESAVRSAAISLGFSPPNFVKLLPSVAGRIAVIPGGKPFLAADREPNTTSAFVDFPSTEAAQVFVDACRRDFSLQGKRIRLELARLYVGSLATITAADAKLEWVCIVCENVNRPGCPLCLQCRTPRLADSPTIAPSKNSEELGPSLPYPDMNEFVMDRKSGMLYSESLGLYFDPQTQQFISVSGIYYMKGTTAEPTLVPVFRMAAPGLGIQQMQQFPADFSFPRVGPSGGGDEGASDAVEVAEVDPTTSKASAVASILAAAQYAAKQTKRIKTKTTSESKTSSVTDGIEGLVDAAIPSTVAPKRSITDQGIQGLNFQSMFDDTAVEEEKREEATDSGASIMQPSSPGQIKAQAASPPAEVLGDHGDHICFVCLRQFRNGQQLATHELESQLHKRNSELQGIERGAH